MERLLIRGARILDPASGADFVGDLLIEGGRIAWLGPARRGRTHPEGTAVLDARGWLACPGFVDLHTHLREPGQERKETLATGLASAVRGGFTTVCAMPNTDPPMDHAGVVVQVVEQARRLGLAHLLPVGCVTRGRKGESLADLQELAEAGCVAFSDDGDPVASASLLRAALLYAQDRPVMDHCSAPAREATGVHEGWVSARMGLRGQPASLDDALVARDLAVLREVGGRLHLCHLTTWGSVDLLRRAKEEGLPVSAEATPHHLVLTDAWLMGPSAGGVLEAHDPYAPLTPSAYDPRAKVNPPLRSEEHRQALVSALREGLIDAVATDHAPHAPEDKMGTVEESALGLSGLETAFALLMVLVHRGELDLPTLIARLTAGPARVLGREDLGALRTGGRADLVLLDPEEAWTVDPTRFASRGRNTPLEGLTLRGRVKATFVAGRPVFLDEGVRPVLTPATEDRR